MKLNKLKQIQGIKPKQRIDIDCVRNAIKSINSKQHSHLPKKTGGLIKKERENNLHMPKTNISQEVT